MAMHDCFSESVSHTLYEAVAQVNASMRFCRASLRGLDRGSWLPVITMGLRKPARGPQAGGHVSRQARGQAGVQGVHREARKQARKDAWSTSYSSLSVHAMMPVQSNKACLHPSLGNRHSNHARSVVTQVVVCSQPTQV